MHSKSLPAPTKAEKRRFEIMAQEIGCLVHTGSPAQIHHLLHAGKRISHSHTIPLCWHCHQGPEGVHKDKIRFHDNFGTDEELLAKTNRLVAAFEGNIIGGRG